MHKRKPCAAIAQLLCFTSHSFISLIMEYLFLELILYFSSGCHQWEYSQWTGFACQRPKQEQVNSYMYIFNLWMVGGSVFMVYMGHLYIWAMVVVIQIFMATEIFNLLRRSSEEKQLSGLRLLNW